jgi:nitrate/nitrite transporter NarK
MLRTIGGTIVGIIIFVVVLALLEQMAHLIFPASGAERPPGMLAFVALAYFLSALAGGVVAARISGARWVSWVIAAIVAAGAAYTLTTTPHPLWMQIAAIVAPLLGGLVASRIALARRVPANEKL